MHLGRRLWSLLLFFAVSLLGGVLVAGLIVPATVAVASLGLAVTGSADQLPANLDTPDQIERSKLLMADGTTLAWFYDENRQYRKLDQIAEIMQQAQVAIEDHRFFEHGAIDLTGTLRALLSTSQGVTQGGSSITQQYVRLVLVENAQAEGDADARYKATENTLARKIRELKYAIAVERKFSKEEILERYLNIAYYGDGAYGVQAAAQHYFSVSADKLTLAQAAMLAGLVRNPVATRPTKYPQIAIERRNNVLDRMLELKIITSEQAAEAKAEPFDQKKVKQYRNGCVNSKYPFVCDYAKRSLLQNEALGATEDERQDLLNRGGLTIKTHFDIEVQDAAEKQIAKLVAPTDPIVSVVTAVEPSTGYIVAMAQSRPDMGEDWKKGQTYHNYAAGTSMGGAEGFQAGSTFKMFVAAAALANGIGVNTQYDVQGRMNFKGRVFQGCDGSVTINKDWNVVGAAGNNMNMYTGVARSVNGYFVQLEQAVGICKSVEMAEDLGLKTGSGEDIMKATFNGSIASFTLGAVEITPLSMVQAYATIANEGVRCEPVIVSSIKTKATQENDSKELLAKGGTSCKKTALMDKDLANTVASVFRKSVEGGTSHYMQMSGIQMAGKTGTVTDNKAIWQVAVTPTLAAAAVISYDSNPNYNEFWDQHRSNYIKGVRVHGTAYGERGYYLSALSGYEAGYLLLRPVFAKAMETRDHENFGAPDQSILRGESATVPSCSGLGLEKCKRRIEAAGFTWSVSTVDSDSPKGDFLGTSPSGTAPKGASITLRVSGGKSKAQKEKEAKEAAAKAKAEAEAKKQAQQQAQQQAAGGDQGQANP
ncbi:MAG: penicillin-binding protein [Propionibacteriaceae bacterium]|jgi:membrane peptidoglycan carboxypeptidase|nr:penicillin-binding protein [Propionibacteriaceae bacterium]